MAMSRYTVPFLIFMLCFAVYRCSAGSVMDNSINACSRYTCGDNGKCPQGCECYGHWTSDGQKCSRKIG
uniref:Putative tick defensin n=1 Tax=Rhipicephalus pulchellus TaxID=72859 RepID=L7MCI6_RHIPC